MKKLVLVASMHSRASLSVRDRCATMSTAIFIAAFGVRRPAWTCKKSKI